MSSIIENAMKHFASLGLQSVDVPEWGEDGVPQRVCWTPITLKERAKLMGDGQITLDKFCDVLIMKAIDADGKKLFTLEDKPHMLNKVEPSVIIRVAHRILQAPSLEDAEKN